MPNPSATVIAPSEALSHRETERETLARVMVEFDAVEIGEDGRVLAAGISSPLDEPRIVTAQRFAAIEEPGAEPLLGEPDEVVIPEGGDVMLHGDGGASKTTLTVDLACHMAAGDDFLGAPVPRPVRVAIFEVEGPRPLFRRKVDGKIESWQGSDLGDRLLVLESPWADFRFDRDERVAALLGDLEVDVLIVGPLTCVGMDENGTLQQVRDFMAGVNLFRQRTGRRLTVILVHHDNKGGAVSGAWEGAVDTLLQAQVHMHGKTRLVVYKARWAPSWHKKRLELAWTDGEGFEVTGGDERDLLTEIKEWLTDHPPSLASEIAAGIGAREVDVRAILQGNGKCFSLRTGQEAKELGRSPTGHLWELIEDAG